MTRDASDLVFVDTNVLVYFRSNNDSRKQRIATDWLRRLANSQRGRISTQVLVEFYAVAMRGVNPDIARARADVEDFAMWQPVPPSVELFRRAWAVGDRYSLSWWDAMIVGAALTAGCTTLLTEDMQDGLVIDQTLTIMNPFTAS